MTRDQREGTSVLSLEMCAESNCGFPQWTSERRGKVIVHSVFCAEHANVPLFDMPIEWKPLARRSHSFRSEVERQRLERDVGQHH
jgi:hypothetical protein